MIALIMVKEGKMNIPQSLYDFFNQDVVLIGAGDVIEIWNKEAFDEYCENMRKEFESLMDISF